MCKQEHTTAFPLIIKAILPILNFGCDVFDTFELERLLHLFNTYNICVHDLSSSGILCSLTDVSGQPIYPTFKSQAFQKKKIFLDCTTLEVGIDMLS